MQRSIIVVIAAAFLVCASAALGMAASQEAGTPLELAVVKPIQHCTDLSALDLESIGGKGSSVTGASETTSGGIAVCSVTAHLAPAINLQVLLPLATWQQRYLQVGCGGLCGNITLQSGASEGCHVLAGGGFVMAATDMGHDARDGNWGLDEQKRIDFAYRAQHVTAQAAKAMIQAFYGQPQKFAYFNGCSDGGREALMEAQRYPDDFDGVIAGAPAMLFQAQNTLYHGWQAVSNTATDGSVILTSDRLPLLHSAAIDACDARDGVKDGLIAQPAGCTVDLTAITCKPGASGFSDCLTPAEAEVARRFYDGPRDSATGLPLTAGQPLPGSELNWQGVYVADDHQGRFMSPMAALPVLRTLAFPEPRMGFTLHDLRFDIATLDALRIRHPLYDATDPNLDAFAKSGRKLILWHGLADPHIAPANTLAYHKALISHMGGQAVENFERLYLLPGVSHCGGGLALSHFDLLTPMMAWVERGVAPDGIATRSTGERNNFGQPDFRPDGGRMRNGPPAMKPLVMPPLAPMNRPVFPYPHVATYSGHGDVGEADNWIKGPAEEIVALRLWPGQNLFAPYKGSER